MRVARVFLPILALLATVGCDSKDTEKSEGPNTDNGAATTQGDRPPAPAPSYGQTFVQAIQVLCDAPTAEGVAMAAPSERMRRMARHIDSKVTNTRVSDAFKALAEVTPTERYERVKGFVIEAKVSQCPLLEYFSKEKDATPVAEVDPVPASLPAAGTAESTGEEAEKAIPLESHYLGEHKIGVNRVNAGKRNGPGKIFREANALVLQASVKNREHHLDISGIVEPVSKDEFVLDGYLRGVPDLSFRKIPPAEQTTQGRFTFRTTKGRTYWRLYEVDGVECVCNDNCGNDFCYIDLSF